MRKIALLWICMVIGLMGYGQEGQFSQYFSTKVLLNPAFAGITPVTTLTTNYQTTAKSDDGTANEIFQASFIMPLKKTTHETYQVGGVAATFYKEKSGFSGIYQVDKFLLSAAYSMRLNAIKNNHLVFALQAGLVNRKIDGSNLQWGSQYNPYLGVDLNNPSEEISENLGIIPVVNMGLVFASFSSENVYFRDRSYMFGISLDNLNQPESGNFNGGEYKRPIMMKMNGFIEFKLKPRVSIHPSILILYQQGSYQINGGLYLSGLVSNVMSDVTLVLQAGIWYRVEDSVIGLMGMKVGKFRVSASMDFNTKGFNNHSSLGKLNNAFEIALGYEFSFDPKSVKVSNPLF